MLEACPDDEDLALLAGLLFLSHDRLFSDATSEEGNALRKICARILEIMHRKCSAENNYRKFVRLHTCSISIREDQSQKEKDIYQLMGWEPKSGDFIVTVIDDVKVYH